jgi:hypothetical protein
MFLTLDSKFSITQSVCSNEAFLELSAAIIQGARVRIATMFDTHCSLLRNHIIHCWTFVLYSYKTLEVSIFDSNMLERREVFDLGMKSSLYISWLSPIPAVF